MSLSAINPLKRWRVFGVTTEAWAKRWGLEPFSVTCHGCGQLKTTTLPFYSDGSPGLMSPPCDCDNQAPYCFLIPDGALSVRPAKEPKPKRRNLWLASKNGTSLERPKGARRKPWPATARES